MPTPRDILPLLSGLLCLRLSILLLFPVLLYSQQVWFDRISLTEGLSQSTVFGIAQDRQGFMWFATQDGVNRFDGFEFSVYRNNSRDSNSLVNNYSTRLFLDRNEGLWISSRDSRISRLNLATERWRRYSFDPAGRILPPGRGPSSVCEDVDSTFWIGYPNGVVHYFPDNDSVDIIDTSSHRQTGNQLWWIKVVYLDRKGRLWVGGENGLSRYNRRTGNFDLFTLSGNRKIDANAIAETPDGKLWCAAEQGLLEFDEDKQHIRRIPYDAWGSSLNCIASDQRGMLWIGSFVGLYSYAPSNGMIRKYKMDPNDPHSISSDVVISIFCDRSGVMWFGTYMGINRFAPSRIKFESYQHKPENVASVNENRIRSFSEDALGAIWIGTMSGVTRFEPKTRKFTRIAASKETWVPGFSDGLLWVTREGRSTKDIVMWFGSNGWGIYKLTFPRTGGLGQIKIRQSIGSETIESMTVDRTGRVWAGSISGTLWNNVEDEDTFRMTILAGQTERFQLPNEIVTILEDRSGMIWFGSLGSGLYRYDPTTRILERFNQQSTDTTSLSNNNAISLYEDRQGTLWIGTYSGLNAFDQEKHTFRHIGSRDGLPNEVIYGILEDDHGNLWLSTNKGLSRMNIATGTIRSFEVGDGLQDNEFNQGAAYRARDGRMYFGGINGFSTFHPDSIYDNPMTPNVVITDFRVFNESVAGILPNTRFTGPISFVDTLRLTYLDAVFSFSFAALEYTNPAKNSYAYMMEGFDATWTYAESRREATYTNLDAGEYVFRVKATNNDGVWSENGTEVVIVIEPPFWKAWWFRGILIAIFLSIGPLIYWRRVTQLKHEHRQQQNVSRQLIESQESERKRIAAELHDGLGQDLLIISNRTQMATAKSSSKASVEEQLKEIAETVTSAIQNVRMIAHNLRPYQIDRLGLTKAIQSIVRNVGESTKLAIVADVDPLDGIFPKDNEIHVYRIIQESVNNILKHAHARSVAVTVHRVEGTVRMIISDDGQGFDTAILDRARERHSGFGLSGIAERVRIMGGTIEFDSAPSHGTRVTINLPLS